MGGKRQGTTKRNRSSKLPRAPELGLERGGSGGNRTERSGNSNAQVCYLICIASIIYCLTNLTYFKCLSIPLIRLCFFRSAYMILFYLYIINVLVIFLAAAHSYLFLCLRLSTECLVSASELDNLYNRNVLRDVDNYDDVGFRFIQRLQKRTYKHNEC